MKRVGFCGEGRNHVVRFFLWTLLVLSIFVAGNSAVKAQQRAKSTPPEIVIYAKRYEFVPSRITVEAGKPVRLVFISKDVTHSIAVPDLGIDMPIVRNRSNQVVITPAKTGDFAGECARYCGIHHDKMTFVVHVVP